MSARSAVGEIYCGTFRISLIYAHMINSSLSLQSVTVNTQRKANQGDSPLNWFHSDEGGKEVGINRVYQNSLASCVTHIFPIVLKGSTLCIDECKDIP